MQKLSLTKRPAQIGASIPTRTEKHGDDDVGALTIPIKDIVLFAKDLIAIYADEDAHSRLFKTDPETKIVVPAFSDTILYITNKFKGAKVTLQADTMDKPLILKPYTVDNIVLVSTESSGLIEMSCTLKGAPADDDNVNVLRMLNRKCTISILNGSVVVKAAKEEVDENQVPLDLGEGGPDDESESGGTAVEREEEEATLSATGRKIARTESKRRAKENRKKNLN